MNELVGEIILIIGIINNDARVVSVRRCLEVVVVERRRVRRVVHGWEGRKRERVVAVEVLLMQIRVLLDLVIIVQMLMLLLVGAGARAAVGRR